MTMDADIRRTKKESLLQFYRNQEEQCSGTISPIHIGDQDDPLNIDGPKFDSYKYLKQQFKSRDLSQLMSEESELTERIRSLDSEMQTLVYDNYSKFISATDTIRMMKSDFTFVEEEMKSLAENMAVITRLSNEILDELHENRDSIRSLTSTQQTLQKLQYLVQLPERLRSCIMEEQWPQAVQHLTRAKAIFGHYHNSPALQGIQKDCSDIVLELSKKLWQHFKQTTDASRCSELLHILKKLGEPSAKLSKEFLSLAKHRLFALLNQVEKEAALDCSDSSDQHPDLNGSPTPSKVATDLLRPDILLFANSITDCVLDQLSSYATVYVDLFCSSASVDHRVDSMLLQSTGGISSKDVNWEELSKTALEQHLIESIDEVFSRFFGIITKRFALEENTHDTALLIRASDRIHSRVQTFGRLLMASFQSDQHANLTESKVLPTNSPSDSGVDAVGVHTASFVHRISCVALEFVSQVARSRTQYYLETLFRHTIDAITEIRQQLVNHGLKSLITGPSRELAHCKSLTDRTTTEGKLTELYHSMSATLVSHLRTALKMLQIFLSTENTFSSKAAFHTSFCLDQVREGLVVAYIRFLTELCKDIAEVPAGGIPGPILLLMAKLCLDWANSGTIGHLLAMADDLLSVGGLPWSGGASHSTGSGSQGQDAQNCSVQRMLSKRVEPPTAPGPLADGFREVATSLLGAFVCLEGTNLAQLLRKSVEARDWLKNLEPRSVRSVVKRILEDLNLLDKQITQLLPSQSRGKDRSSNDSYSWRASSSGIRTVASSGFLTAGVSMGPGNGGPGGSAPPELDPALATHLRRLFTQRIDIFAPVQAHRESLLFGVIKIGLKTFIECARLKTFGKFGLQQIQVDCRYLQIHLWPFVNDEKLVSMLLDDVIYSVMQRCVEPQLMEESIVEAICDRA